MRKNKDAYKNYVCPYCFNQLNKCTCELFPPYNLVMIDEAIQEHIRLLNQKKYLTIGCCEGHYNSYCTECYIAFADNYKIFDSLPDEFHYNKNRRMIICNKFKCKSEEEYNINKQHSIEVLLEWIKQLPNN